MIYVHTRTREVAGGVVMIRWLGTVMEHSGRSIQDTDASRR